MHIETDNLLLAEGLTYSLKKSKGNPLTFYQVEDTYWSLEIDNGVLQIIKHDLIDRILYRKFKFIGTTSNGNKVDVTEGSFDICY